LYGQTAAFILNFVTQSVFVTSQPVSARASGVL